VKLAVAAFETTNRQHTPSTCVAVCSHSSLTFVCHLPLLPSAGRVLVPIALAPRPHMYVV
jgi:hypothetical protein